MRRAQPALHAQLDAERRVALDQRDEATTGVGRPARPLDQAAGLRLARLAQQRYACRSGSEPGRRGRDGGGAPQRLLGEVRAGAVVAAEEGQARRGDGPQRGGGVARGAERAREAAGGPTISSSVRANGRPS